MKRVRNIQEIRARRLARTRAKIDGTEERPRLTVRRTLAHIYAQVVDDTRGKTLASASDLDLSAKDTAKKTKTEVAFLVGKAVAERAKAAKVGRVVFDRRDKKYHGRVKAVADGAREGGLEF
jgi:large subunit ribosomal protein L18